MNYKQSQQERSHMKLKHPKLATACAVLAMLIIAILFLPVIPFSSPGTMGGGSSSVMDHIITPYPPNQPDSLPVYRVTDYVDIVDDTTKIYDYDKDPYNQNDLREWMTKIFKDELDLPLPMGDIKPEFYESTDIPRTFYFYQKVDGMELYPSEIRIYTNNPPEPIDIGYTGYKLENVGEIKIMSAQEAHKLLNTGHDMSMISRVVIILFAVILPILRHLRVLRLPDNTLPKCWRWGVFVHTHRVRFLVISIRSMLR